MIELIPVSRIARAGCSSGVWASWLSTSGDKLIRTQLTESEVTAIEDWVRGRPRTFPLRKPAQLRQLQFHCGKPPPAAAPSTTIRIVFATDGCRDEPKTTARPLLLCEGCGLLRTLSLFPGLAGPDVHRYFKTEAQFFERRFSPIHEAAPSPEWRLATIPSKFSQAPQR